MLSGSTQLTLNLIYKTSFDEADFIPLHSNREAYNIINQWPNWPIRSVAICGASGCGKTHLAHIWQSKSNATFLDSVQVDFSSPPNLITEQNTAFVVDNADQIKDQEWLFHFYNLIQEKKGFLLFCAKSPPAHWGVTLADLASRLSTVMTVIIPPPDDMALKQIILKQFSDRGLYIEADLIDYILNRIERSFESIRSIVDTIDRYTLAFQRSPSPAMVRDILQNGESHNNTQAPL